MTKLDDLKKNIKLTCLGLPVTSPIRILDTYCHTHTQHSALSALGIEKALCKKKEPRRKGWSTTFNVVPVTRLLFVYINATSAYL